MRFGIHVQTAGTTWLDSVARILSEVVRTSLADVQLSEADGLYIGLFASSQLPQGLRKVKKKVRRDYKVKVVTGGSQHFNCLVELDVEVADADLVASANTETSLFGFVQGVVLRCLPMALDTFTKEDLALVQAAVSAAHLSHEPRY